MTTNTQQNEFIQALQGDLTPEQAAQLLELGELGDTGAMPDNGGAPDASTDAGDAGNAEGDAGTNQPNTEAAAAAGEPAKPDAQEGAAGDAEPDPANAVVLAKDGKHTIPYDKLVQAREGEKHWKAQAEAAQRHFAMQVATQTGDHLGCQQRVAAQFKEVIVQADPLNAQQLGPQAGYSPLGIGLWRPVLAACCSVRLR